MCSECGSQNEMWRVRLRSSVLSSSRILSAALARFIHKLKLVAACDAMQCHEMMCNAMQCQFAQAEHKLSSAGQEHFARQLTTLRTHVLPAFELQ